MSTTPIAQPWTWLCSYYLVILVPDEMNERKLNRYGIRVFQGELFENNQVGWIVDLIRSTEQDEVSLSVLQNDARTNL